MTQSELLSSLNKASNAIAKGNFSGYADYIVVSKKFYDYFNNTKSQIRMEKINRILNEKD